MDIEDLIKIDKRRSEPLYMQIYIQIKRMVEKGIIKEGTKLPTIRKLSKILDVNSVTVVNAYHMLEEKGLAYSIVGSGTYIGADGFKLEFSPYGETEFLENTHVPSGEEYINFASSNPSPELFPVEEFKDIFTEVLDRDGGLAFTYQESMGYRPLRESIANLLSKDGIRVDPRNILVISGAQQGLDIISKVLLGQGDNVLVERPTYAGAIAVFKSRGAEISEVPLTYVGMDVSYLEGVLKEKDIKMLYLMPEFQNPTGICYSEETKEKIIELSKKHRFFIVEDDFSSDIYFKKKPAPFLRFNQPDNVIFIKSFSKVFMPGLRLAFMILPDMLIDSIQVAKYTSDIATSGFFQRVLQLFIDKGQWDSHTEMLRSVYGQRCDFMARCLKSMGDMVIDFEKPLGGLNFWITLPDGLQDKQVYNAAIKEKVIVAPGSFFYMNSPEQNHLRLGFSSVDEEKIKKGMDVIKKILTVCENKCSKHIEPLF